MCWKRAVETGRYTVPKTPEHFSCTLCETLRNKFFHDKIIKKYNFFKYFDVKSKILFLFNNIDPFICKSVCAFIFVSMDCRHYHVISKVT